MVNQSNPIRILTAVVIDARKYNFPIYSQFVLIGQDHLGWLDDANHHNTWSNLHHCETKMNHSFISMHQPKKIIATNKRPCFQAALKWTIHKLCCLLLKLCAHPRCWWLTHRSSKFEVDLYCWLNFSRCVFLWAKTGESRKAGRWRKILLW